MIWRPKSVAGQMLWTTIVAMLLAQILSSVFFGLFVVKPQAVKLAGIMAQSIDAISDVSVLSDAAARAAIVARLDASPYVEVWPGDTQPPASGPAPTMLEWVFLRALAEAKQNTEDIVWRTDQGHRLWVKVGVGPEHYWISAQSLQALQVYKALFASGAAAVLLAMAAVVTLQRRISRPLETLTAAVQDYRLDSRATVVEVQGPQELVALSQGFNAMTARLAAADRERTFLLAGVSHDLRTPLAKLRLAVELLAPGDDGQARAAHRYVEEIDRVLGQFLTFARGFDAEPIVDFDVGALLSEIVAMREVEGHNFDLQCDVSRTLQGRPESLRRALVNLTDNAVRYGAAPFSVGARALRNGIEFYVRDGGQGAPSEQLNQLSRPFERGEEASTQSPGTGLGLAIVERVAQLHGGELTLTNLLPVGFEARLRIIG